MKRNIFRISLCLVGVLIIQQGLFSQTEWPYYGNDAGGARFSQLKQINTGNVASLQRAWTFHTGDKSGKFQGTPILVGGVMYLSKAKAVFAVEPETGKQIWKYDTPSVTADRGLSVWVGNKNEAPRVLVGTGTQLLELDASTGKPAADFGNAGYVDLKAPLPGPPAILRNLAIVGSRGTVNDVRAFDVHSGKLVWTFHTIPHNGEAGYESWDGGTPEATQGYVWGTMSIDAERGLIYVPIKAPGRDFYGGDRKGDDLFGNCLVALDGATGKLVWYRQLVHHDVWDYDLAAEPALIEVTRNGTKIPAVAQITKMGLLFIFDRTNGKPLYDIEERPVPQSEVPGETLSKTQPFPVAPPPLARNSITKEDIYNLTPEHAAFCKDLWEKYSMYNDGPYTAYDSTEHNAVIFPGTLGGGNWNGVSFDPTLGYMFTNTQDLGQIGRLQQVNGRNGTTYSRVSSTGGMGRFWDPDKFLPCQNPPWGQLIAVDVNTGKIAWQVPLGIVEELAAKGITNTGAPNLGGSIVTAGGLVFIAATTDKRFRAFDSRTGKELWVTKLDSQGYAVPMTYMGKNGKQYVVIPAGGGKDNFQPLNETADTLVAFALP